MQPDNGIMVGDIDEAEQALAEMVELAIKQARASLPFRERIAQHERRLYEAVGHIPAEIEAREEALRQFAKANARTLFADKKTAKLHHGELKQTTGKPAVKTVDGKTEDDAALRIERRDRHEFIRQTPKLDKDAIIRFWQAGEVTDAQLADLHLKVVQTTSYTVKPREPKDVETVVDEQAKCELESVRA